MKLAIVILNWNGSNLLERFLPSILAYSKPYPIFIIDNASTDNSLHLLATKFPEVKVIRNKNNYGFAKGYNLGLRQLDFDVFCLLNSDVEVTENWLTPVIQTFSTCLNTAIIQPKIKHLNHKKMYFDYAGAAGGLIDYFGYPYCRGRYHSFIEKDEGQYPNNAFIFWASGACFFIRKKAFSKLKGFDEDYESYQEEVDLCWRAKHLRYDVQYVGTTTVYHLNSASFGINNPKKTFYNFRNTLITITKNVSKNKIIFVVLVRLILDGLAGLMFLFQGKFSHTLAILKAHLSYYRTLKKTLQKRKKINRMQLKYYSMISVLVFFCIKKIKNKCY